MKYLNKGKIDVSFLGLIAIALLVSSFNQDTVAQASESTENSNSPNLCHSRYPRISSYSNTKMTVWLLLV